MSNLIKTEVYLPKNFHLYQVPKIFHKPFEIKEEVFQAKSLDPYKLYVVIGDDREKGTIKNAVFWNSLGGALLFESEYQKKYSDLELTLWEKVEESLIILSEYLATFEKKPESQNQVNLNELYHFNNHLLMYDGELDPFDYFMNNIPWRKKKGQNKELLVLTDITQNSMFKKVNIPEENLLEFSLMYALYLKDLNSMKRKKTLKDSLRLIEEFFNKMTVPISVFDEFNDLSLHNKKFRDMELLSDKVLAYKDNQTMDHKGELYTVSVRKIDVESKEYKIFTFLRGSDDAQNLIQMEEMGVITSSIAHELNNPIGGVLNGTEVLTSIDFGISEDGLDILHEIRKSSLRCSNLIKTFLGFARHEMGHDQQAEIEDAIDQSLSFLRTRFMELGCKINIHYIDNEVFPIRNISLWTMIFYSFFTNIINFVSRESLVRETNVFEIPLKITLNQGDVSMTLENYDLEDVASELMRSSFFHHLLNSDGIELKYESKSVVFSRID